MLQIVSVLGALAILQRFAVKLNHNTVSTLALAQEVFSEGKHVAGSEGGSITVQTAVGVAIYISFA